jgi:lipopolysaccharide export system permease protein
MLAVTFVLLLIFMSGRFIKYLGQAASGSLSPDILFSVMAFRLPGFLELILPLGLFMGVLLAYGRMYLESEMTVLHACGFSRLRLATYSLMIGALVAGMVALMSLYLSPAGMQKVESLFEEQARKTEFEMLSPGRFQSLSSGERVTYAGSLSEDKKTMYDVFISDSSSGANEINTLYAEQGVQSVDPETGSRFLILQNGRQYQGVPGLAGYKELAFDSYGILVAEPSVEQRKVKEEARETETLFYAEDPLSRSILYWRFSLILLVPVVTIIAVAMCKVNPRQGRYMHLFPAMLLYVLYLGLLIVAKKQVAEAKVDPMFVFGGVHLLFSFIALVLFNKETLFNRSARKAVGVSVGGAAS